MGSNINLRVRVLCLFIFPHPCKLFYWICKVLRVIPELEILSGFSRKPTTECCSRVPHTVCFTLWWKPWGLPPLMTLPCSSLLVPKVSTAWMLHHLKLSLTKANMWPSSTFLFSTSHRTIPGSQAYALRSYFSSWASFFPLQLENGTLPF